MRLGAGSQLLISHISISLYYFLILFKVNQKPSTVQLNPDTMELYVLCHRSQDGLIKLVPKPMPS